MNDMLKLNARDALKTSTGPVVSPQGGAETEIGAKLQQPEAPAATMPPNALDFSPTELAAVLETASRSARNSASALIGLLAQLEVPTQRVSYYEDLVDKPHHLKAGKDRDLNFTRSSPSILDGIKEETATKLRRELGVKSIGEFAATSAEVLATLVTPKDPVNGITPAQLVPLLSIHRRLETYEDASPRVDLARLGKARKQLESAQGTVLRMAEVLEERPIALTNSLVRISATFQWLEDCQARLEKLSDEAVVRATKGGAKAVREELDSIRAVVPKILSKKAAFFDAKTTVDEGQIAWDPALHDTTTALLTQPLASSPFVVHQIPNLNPTERIIEKEFASAFQAHPRRMVREFIKMVRRGGGNVIEPDNAKLLCPRFARPDLMAQIAESQAQIQSLNGLGTAVAAAEIERLELTIAKAKTEIKRSRAESNIPTHMTATAIARLTLVQMLEDLANDKSIPADQKTLLITGGGCAAGKGTSLTKAGELVPAVKTASLVYDTDGETSGVFNEFVLAECRKHGIKPTFLYVHADPVQAWDRVYSRADQVGRMVSEEPFLDSHVDSPRNFNEFFLRHRRDKDVTFVIIDNSKGGAPELVNELPASALRYNRDELRHVIRQKTDTANVDPHAQKIAQRSRRIWEVRTHG